MSDRVAFAILLALFAIVLAVFIASCGPVQPWPDGIACSDAGARDGFTCLDLAL